MRCLGCKAWKDGKCLAGVTPYRSKNERDGIGCACNTRTVEKLMRQNRKTNADRIRAMTDEELAEFINDVWDRLLFGNDLPGMCDVCYTDTIQNCKKCWLDWLKEEATANDS